MRLTGSTNYLKRRGFIFLSLEHLTGDEEVTRAYNWYLQQEDRHITPNPQLLERFQNESQQSQEE